MTIEELYDYGIERLSVSGIREARIDAWYLLEHATGLTRAIYFIKKSEQVSAEHEAQYKAMIQTRSKRIPLQHIIGIQEFMGHSFRVNRHVLIPRQDTECLVESVQQYIQPDMKVLDMCTGSGCILISLLLGLTKENRLKEAEWVGADISDQALLVARENAKMHGVSAMFVQSDLFEDVRGSYDIVVSNPPYIATGAIKELQEEVKNHDPMIALDGKEDGLYFYKRIVAECGHYMTEHGRLFFEIGYDQGGAVSELMKDQGFEDVIVKKDLSGLDRVVIGVYNSQRNRRK